jgi:hypothetical protein
MLVVVAGHSRNIGKTSVVAGLIRTLPHWNWTAVKITQFGHGICSASGTDCHCCLEQDHPFAIARETQPGRSDTGRFLKAGARDSYWVRTAVGNLGCALPSIRKLLEASENTIIESNSIMQFVEPELYLMVLDFAVEDFKDSARRFLDRADAYVVIERSIGEPRWKNISGKPLNSKPCFRVQPPLYTTAALSNFVNDQLAAALICPGSG